MRKIFFYSAVASLSILVLSTCKVQEENIETELSLDAFKSKLAYAQEVNNLITSIENTDGKLTVGFELGDPLSIPNYVLKEITYDSLNWKTLFRFADQSSQTANFVGKLNLDNNSIYVNPYLTCPLVAVAEIKTPVKGKFKISVKGKSAGGIAIEKMMEEYSDSHSLPILGLYENYSNQVELIFMSEGDRIRCSQVITIPVPIISKNPDPGFQILKDEMPSQYQCLYMIFSHKMAFDQKGELRWYFSGVGANFFCKLRNGNFISASQDSRSFSEYTMLGQLIKKYDVPNLLHHEIIEIPSGNFLVATHSAPGPPREDVVVEVDRITGVIVRTWDFNLILDPLRKPLPDSQKEDWLHVNAIYYDEEDNSVVVSARSQCAVIKIDYATGAIKWILGNPANWDGRFQSSLLQPVDISGNPLDVSNVDFWNYGQHAIQKTGCNKILMYDNGDYRNYYDNANVSQNSYTRMVEYTVDEKAKTVQLTWQFDNNKSVFTRYTGFVQRLPLTQSCLVAYMGMNIPKIIELDNNNNVVFEASLKDGNGIYYRTMKVDLYEGLNNN